MTTTLLPTELNHALVSVIQLHLAERSDLPFCQFLWQAIDVNCKGCAKPVLALLTKREMSLQSVAMPPFVTSHYLPFVY